MAQLHFIAIGGSAMHNLAIALHHKGEQISGSDDEIFEPSRSRLEKLGLLPEKFGWFPEKIHSGLDAVILGMHAKADNPELIKAQQIGVPVFSYPEFLFEQSKHKKRVVIGGSHGKTTITAMILHVLKKSGIEADYMVGAQLEGFEVMVKLSDTAEWMIIEGDEYLTSPIDRVPKFLHYHPHIAVISGIGWDHVNVFPTFENYLHQFRLFIQAIEKDGSLIYSASDPEVEKLAAEVEMEKIPYYPHDSALDNGELNLKTSTANIPIKVFGNHNLMNISAALEVCRKMGVGDAQFYDAIGSFMGASRRMEPWFAKDQFIVYRDFAHAPSKLSATVSALREQYPNRKLVVCYELHTYSSLSEVFIDHYKHSLDPADEAVVFYDPHAVAIKKLELMPIDRIRSGFGKMDLIVHSTKHELLDYLTALEPENTVLALMSSGSFNGLERKDIIDLFQ
jgi:UDP-N-acetylmuramate: L-alanyl-gamma-D-glutamyl-meso-diaminopimelate ligase